MKSLILSLGVILSFSAQATLPDWYNNVDAKAKQQVLWEQVKSNTGQNLYPNGLPKKNPGFFEMLALLDVPWLFPSFEAVTDEAPLEDGKPRKKLIHTYGTVAKVRFNITESNPYTGLFQSGAVGLARLSVARMSSDLTPGMAVKFLIDKDHPSVNLHVMFKLDGQGSDHNWFANKFSNDLEPPNNQALFALEWAFEKAVKKLGGRSGRHRPVDHIATTDDTGAFWTPLFPRKIIFKPVEETQQDKNDKTDFRVKLSKLPAGSKLYDVYTAETAESEAVKVGELVTESEFVASEYGDRILWFQHNL